MTVLTVLGSIVRAWSIWGLTNVSLEEVSTCIVIRGNCMRPCVESMTALLFLIKCNPVIRLVIFFIATKYSAKMLFPISN